MKLTRRNFVKLAGIAGLSGFIANIAGCVDSPNLAKADDFLYGDSDNHNVKVYLSNNIDAQSLIELYNRISSEIKGRVGIKVHTGEPKAPNILSRDMVKALQAQIPNSAIIETNTLYDGARSTTERHRRTLEANGWTFCPVDILDEEGDVAFPVNDGFQLKEVYMGSHLTNYDSLVVLTHFKGHAMAGFGGSLKNIAIGCASKRGKQQIHGDDWTIGKTFLERMTDSGKAICDHFGKHIVYINVLQRLSIDCDCVGAGATAPELPDLGMLASTDILAVEQAAVDMIYNFQGEEKISLIERIESRDGLRQLTAMEHHQMGTKDYDLIDID